MGFHGFSPASLILTLLIVVLLFGTRKLRDAGKDIGEAVKNFREGLNGTTPTAAMTEIEKPATKIKEATPE